MTEKSRRLMWLCAVPGFALLAVLAWRSNHQDGGSTLVPSSQPPTTQSSPHDSQGASINDDFSKVLAVFAHGGTQIQLDAAIETLDTRTRLGNELTKDQHAAVLSAMERGTPSGMSDGSWSHLFNSACNTLGVGQTTSDEDFIKLLERIAVNDPRLVMRLYALQHLGVRYDSASPDCQLRLRALVQRILADTESQTAGTALVLWRRWEHSAGPNDASSVDLSRAVVKDAARPVDVRVSALHAIGDDPGVLDLARAIAPDITQPIILRKSALNLIGRHGQSSDVALLKQCSQENPRLAQAGNPATSALQSRLAGSPSPVLTPIQ